MPFCDAFFLQCFCFFLLAFSACLRKTTLSFLSTTDREGLISSSTEREQKEKRATERGRASKKKCRLNKGKERVSVFFSSSSLFLFFFFPLAAAAAAAALRLPPPLRRRRVFSLFSFANHFAFSLATPLILPPLFLQRASERRKEHPRAKKEEEVWAFPSRRWFSCVSFEQRREKREASPPLLVPFFPSLLRFLFFLRTRTRCSSLPVRAFLRSSQEPLARAF